MSEKKRRFSTVTKIDPETLQEIREEAGIKPVISQRDDEIDADGHISFISGYTTPGPNERIISEHKKANLGMMLGVYLPTIQHILGVTMFIRLFWVVGIAGVMHTMLLLLCCCLCTLLTSISLSAVATNGVVESGGAYFMISRNLGVEFGSAVGILFYLANTVAASMYLVGGVEVMLLYIFPSLTIGGNTVHSETDIWGMMSHNYRIYGTAFLLLEVLIVAMGVRFVQLLAPVSLLCVILSILACFAGGIEKAIVHNGQHVCMLNGQLLQTKIFLPKNSDLSSICKYCVKSEGISGDFCNTTSASFCSHFTAGTLTCANAFPGVSASTLKENMQPKYMDAGESYPGIAADDTGLEVSQDFRTNFFILLAIYFPAVTGIMTGTNMSGDLKDPQKSIPCGTIAATLTTSFIYCALAILFGASITGPVLRDKYGRSLGSSMIVALLSWPSPWVVIIGSFLSTFGAALQCLCSAPRLLQSIAKDDVIPALAPFAKVTKSNEPLIGLLFTAFIAELAILLGAVDAIAEVLDFFFLMCYAFVNMICALHSLLGAPNWRPRFKYYHWLPSLMGAFLCFFIMFVSQWLYALIAIILTFVIYKYVEWKGAKKEWGDGIRGLALSTAQYSLMKVEDKDPHPKNWRPQLLVLLEGSWSKEIIDMKCINLLNLAGQLKAGRGLAIVVAFIKGDISDAADRANAELIKERIVRDMMQVPLRGFSKILLYNDEQVEGCVSALFQSVGIGGLKPNTVMINWPSIGDHKTFATKLLAATDVDECIMVIKGITDFPLASGRLNGHIDIWWVMNDVGILVLIAFLLRQNKVWRGCSLRIFTIADLPEKNNDLKKMLQKHIYMMRIDAEVFIVDYTERSSSITISDQTAELRNKTRTKKSTTSDNAVPMDKSKVNAADIQRRTSFIETSFTRMNSKNCISEEENNDDNFNIDANFFKTEKKDSQQIKSASRMNEVILENSRNSQLVILNLPRPPKLKDENFENYLLQLEILTENIPRVLFIGSSGKEVITESS